jgi:hypothetical protein
VLAACGTSSGGTSLSGTNAFTAKSTVLVPKPLHCNTGVLPNGQLDAFSVVISDVDAQSACAMSSFDFLPHVVQLEIGTVGYFSADPGAANDAIVAGTTFPILDENVYDEDLCGNEGSPTQLTGIAMFKKDDGTQTADYWATSGTIKVSSVSASSVEGTFNVSLVADGASQGTISGSFDAQPCP